MIVRLLLAATGMMLGSATVMMMKSAEKASETTSRPAVRSPEISASSLRNSAFAELRERQEVFDRVKALVDARDFAALNAMELEFISTRARTGSGVWKLGLFHGAVHAALGGSDPKHGCALAAGPLLKAWRTATPLAPSPYIATATMLLDRGGCFRGESFARDVPEKAWKPFHDNINAAHEFLSAHKEVAAQDPEFYRVMEDIYRAQGREPGEFQRLLDEATARQPYYYGLYWHAYYYYQPKWHGSIQDIEAAARYAVERTRKQDGLGAYARYYWSASSDGDWSWAEAIDWDTMKLAMRDVAERYRDPWNLANFARLACTLNDREVARLYFDALGQNDGKEAWDDQESWQDCRTLAGALTTPSERSPERCAYAAIEAWPNEDFEKYCRGQ